MYVFLPHGVEIELIFALRVAMSEIWAKIAIFGHEIGNWKKKFQKLHMYPVSPPGVEIVVIFVLRALVSRIEQFKL